MTFCCEPKVSLNQLWDSLQLDSTSSGLILLFVKSLLMEYLVKEQVKYVRPFVSHKKQKEREREKIENCSAPFLYRAITSMSNEQQTLRFEVERAGWGTPQEEIIVRHKVR